jgi:hypothetical protein
MTYLYLNHPRNLVSLLMSDLVQDFLGQILSLKVDELMGYLPIEWKSWIFLQYRER